MTLRNRPATVKTVLRLNDQHTYLQALEIQSAPDRPSVGLRRRHVCTTFDKWQIVLRVDHPYRVIGSIRNFF